MLQVKKNLAKSALVFSKEHLWHPYIKSIGFADDGYILVFISNKSVEKYLPKMYDGFKVVCTSYKGLQINEGL